MINNTKPKKKKKNPNKYASDIKKESERKSGDSGEAYRLETTEQQASSGGNETSWRRGTALESQASGGKVRRK
jgi:hypothetical protein